MNLKPYVAGVAALALAFAPLPSGLTNHVSASIVTTSRLDDLSNGDLVNDDFVAGPEGFMVTGSPTPVVAYDVNVASNGDADDLNIAGQSLGMKNIFIVQEEGNEADNDLECKCVPDDRVGGMITLDFNSPVVSFETDFLDLEQDTTILTFTDSAGGQSSSVSVAQMLDPASQFYQGAGFVLGNATAQQMTNPITAAQLGHVFDNIVFEMFGSEAFGPITYENARLSVGSTVFFDNNDNGAQDDGELGIPGAEVSLLDAGGTIVATTTTDTGGNYFFDTQSNGAPLSPGDYTVAVAAPASSPMASTNSTPADDDVDGTNDGVQAAVGDPSVSAVFTLSPNDEPTTTEAHQGGDQDDGTWDADGNMTIDFGFKPLLSSLGDTVFFDTDDSGVQDNGEVGLPGVTVELLDGPGAVVGTTVTNGQGNYSFDGLTPGDYQVRIPSPPENAPASSSADNLGDDGIDLDDNGAQPGGAGTAITSGTIALGAGENDPTIDFGLIPAVAAVSIEKSTNGVDSDVAPGEVIVVGSPVTWTYTVTNTGTTIVDVTVTDDQGVAVTCDAVTLAPGEVAVCEGLGTAVDGLYTNIGSVVAAPVDAAGNPLVDPISGAPLGPVNASDPSSYTGVPSSGASLGDTVFVDEDGDGIQDDAEPGVEGVVVILWTDDDGDGTPDTQVGTTTTDADGHYLFDDLQPGLDYIVQFVLPDGRDFTTPDAGDDDAADSDADRTTGFTGVVSVAPGATNDTVDAGLLPEDQQIEVASLGDRVFVDVDGNGLQDPGEQGIRGVTVNLWTDDNGDGEPDTQIGTTTTDADGDYSFAALTPGIAYVVEFVAPAGALFTIQNAGSDDVDSDADPTTGRTEPVVLVADEFNPTIDAGILPGALGDTVFEDRNGNGIQDAGDGVVTDVVVNLWVDDNADGIPDRLAGSTTTDEAGTYLFEGLPPAAGYIVEFVAPPTRVFTSRGTGDDDSVDSDADPTSGFSVPNVVVSGETNDTVDAGLLPEEVPADELASIGDTVFLDLDSNGVQNGADSGIGGVTVILEDENGVAVDSVVTDADGTYLFEDLAPGTYTVRIDPSTLPEGATPTGDADGGLDLKSAVTVAAGESNEVQDFGFEVPDEDPIDPVDPGDPDPPDPGGELPVTGGGGIWSLIGIAFILVMAGLAMLLTSEDRRRLRRIGGSATGSPVGEVLL